MAEYVRKIRVDETALATTMKPLLGNLDMELTERCNNNCIHCFINRPADDREALEKELSTQEIKDILAEAAILGCLRVRFTGGEPLLREDFEELYLFARRLGLKVILFTNATLITPRMAELFCRIPPLEKIEITLYGMKKSSYEGVSRVSGSFKAAWRGVNLLLEKEIPFVVKWAHLPPNKEEVDQFETWTTTVPAMDRPPGNVVAFDLRGRKDSEEKNRRIKRLRLAPEEVMKALSRRPQEYMCEMKAFCKKFMGAPGERLFSCGSGLASACVDAFGKVQPCLLLRHPDTTYGIKKGSLKEALTNFFPPLREMTARDPDYQRRCARCFLKGLCDQCPARSWMEHGVLDKPVEYLCDIAHAQARYLGLLKEGERAWEVSDGEARINALR